MNIHFKDIQIGSLIKYAVTESEIDISRICNFFKCAEQEIEQMFLQKDLPTDVLLKWSKLLEYDFFRLYSQHLILYAPPKKIDSNSLSSPKKTSLPQFRKNIYTKEVIDFILELINNGEKTRLQVIEDYRIPKTTLYKWMEKYKLKESMGD